jgi:hypothetical protein
MRLSFQNFPGSLDRIDAGVLPPGGSLPTRYTNQRDLADHYRQSESGLVASLPRPIAAGRIGQKFAPSCGDARGTSTRNDTRPIGSLFVEVRS